MPALELLVARLAHFDAALRGAEALSRALDGATVAHDWERFPEALPSLRERLAGGREPADSPWGTYLFLLGAPRTLVGWGGFKGPPSAGAEVELGYSVAPAFEGRGIATAAVRELLRIADAGRDVAAVTAHTLAEPGPSPRVLVKAGFAQEAVLDEGPPGPIWRWRRARPLLG